MIKERFFSWEDCGLLEVENFISVKKNPKLKAFKDHGLRGPKLPEYPC